MSTLSIQLFGTFQGQIGNQIIDKFRTSKVQALLIYLLVENGAPVRRETLLDLLWPGLPQQSAQVNLRQTLYQLRKVLEGVTDGSGLATDPILSEKRALRLNPNMVLSADVYTFDQLLNHNATHDHTDIRTCIDCQRRLEQAVALYHGDLINDFYLADSNVFEAWAANQRAAYQRRFFDALSTLTAIALRSGQYAEAQAYAERQLAHDNLRESAHRQLMRALAHSGKREMALAQFDKCRTLLHDELGMSPSQRTTQLAEQIAAGEIELSTMVQTPEVRGYELLEKLGGGAYGDVHRAYQPLINREVAVKIIKSEFANRPNFIRRFEVEAQTIAKLEHPYIVPLYDYWREPDGAFLVMRYMRGGNLASEIAQRGAWTLDSTLHAVEQIGAALGAAHDQGIVHRDLKPANILLDQNGNLFLSDFGIARHIIEGSDASLSNDQIFLTSSPYYTSPEQLRGQPVTPRSDIYTFGLLIYELLTGHKPYPDASVGTLLQHHLNSVLPSVREQQSTLPDSLDRVLQRATAINPDERFASVAELVQQLRDVLINGGVLTLPPLLTPQIEGNPYKGLRAFQESDSELFFGRTQLTNQLISNLQSSRFLTVVGPSGSGKSSVVKAGLLPALRRGDVVGSEAWFITEMVPSTHPLEELEAALVRIAVDPPASLLDPLQKDERGLVRVLKRILPPSSDSNGQPSQLLLVIDQFEELFTLVEDDDRRQHFLNLILTAMHAARSQLRIVLTLRADFFDRPLQLPQLAGLVKANSVVVTPLNSAELEEAITRPAALAGVRFEHGLVPRIIDDVRDQPGMLPLLQYALTELYERHDDTTIAQAAYDNLGGIKGVLGQRAEQIYVGLSPNDQALAKQTFLRLVTLGEGVEDTRRRVLQSEMEQLTVNSEVMDEANGSQFTIHNLPFTILSSFGDARLLSFDHDPITRTPTVEVAHEALLREWPRLRNWLRDSRDDLRLQRRLATLTNDYQAAYQDPSFLMRGGQLLQFENWVGQTSVALTADEQHFLNASIAAREAREVEEEARRQRELEQAQLLAETERQRAEEQAASAGRLRQRALLLAGALAIAGVLAVAAIIFGNRATDNANLAATREVEAQNNAAEAQTNANLAVTREAEALSAQVEAERQRTFAREQAELALARELAAQGRIALNEDPELGLLLAQKSLDIVYTQEGETALHSALQTSRARQTYIFPNSVNAILSPDETYVAIYYLADQFFTVHDFATMEPLFSGDGEPMHFINDTLLAVTEPPYDQMRWRVWDVEQQHITDYPVAETFSFPPYLDGWLVTHGWIGYDPTLSLMAYGANDDNGKVTIWDGETGDELATFQAHDSPLGRMEVSADTSLLATSDLNGLVRIWDISNIRASGSVELKTSFEAFVDSSQGGGRFRFTQDKTRVYITGERTLEIWDLDDTAQPVARFLESESLIQYIDLNDDETLLSAINGDDVIYIVDAATGEKRLELRGHEAFPRFTGFSNDGQRFYSSSFDGTVRIWDIRAMNGSEVQAYPLAPFSLRIRVSPDGKLIAVGSSNSPAQVIDRATGEIVHTLEGAWGGVFRLDFSPDGKQLVTVGEDDLIRTWDVSTGKMLLEFKGHESGVWQSFFRGTLDVAYTPDGTRFATASTDEVVKLWDSQTGQLIRTYDDYGAPVNQIAISPDGKYLAAIGQGKESTSSLPDVMLWDVESGDYLRTLGTMNDRSWGMEFHPSEPIIIVVGGDGVVKAWQIETGDELFDVTVPLGGGFGSEPAFIANGDRIAVSGTSTPLTILDSYTGEKLAQLTDFPAENMAYTPDGTLVSIVFGSDSRIREFVVDLDDAIALARERTTREMTELECLQYFRNAACEFSFEEE